MNLAYQNEIPLVEFVQRRTRLLTQMQTDSALIVFSEVEKRRNNDCAFPFRQDSYFWYLTGFNEPNSVLVLLKNAQIFQSILFLQPSDPLVETWTGYRLGVDNAPSKLAIDQAFSIQDIVRQLPKILQKSTALYHLADYHPWADGLLADLSLPQVRLCWKKIVDEMRVIKSPAEIRLLQQAGQISALGHLRVMKDIRENRFEYEIESDILHEFTRHGARFSAYPSIVAGGANACILHYSQNDALLKNGELLLIDAGAEFANYAGDITRTLPINGQFTEAQKAIYNLVLRAQKRAIELLIPGASIRQANDAVIEIFVEGLIELGILQGEKTQLTAEHAYRQFYMHGLCHWLGLDVHDVGDYGQCRDRPLQIGMVLTVEPGLYFAKNSAVPEQYRGIGVRIEDNIVITEYGNKVLTSAVPKEICDIEELMTKARC